MKGVKPGPPGPWSPYRFEIMKNIISLDLHGGDIVVRMGNARVNPKLGDLLQLGQGALSMLGLSQSVIDAVRKSGITEVPVVLDVPFSSMIASVSGSVYSHAAMVLSAGPDPVIVEIGPKGMERQFFRDWMDDIRSDDILFLRYNGSDSGDVIPKVISLLNQEVIRDPDYNGNFSPSTDTLYCVQLPYSVFEKAGVILGPPVKFHEMPGWDNMSDLIATVGDLDRNTPVYHVGNDQVGMLASTKLSKVARISVANAELKIQRL